jgi:hypothetical protein
MKTSKLKKRMSSGSSVTSKLYDKIIKMLSKSHETIPLSRLLFRIVAATPWLHHSIATEDNCSFQAEIRSIQCSVSSQTPTTKARRQKRDIRQPQANSAALPGGFTVHN